MKKALLTLICLAAMMATSTSLKAQEVTLTLMPGYTWISCPMTDTIDFATALGSFIPMENDIIKTQRGLAVYLNGRSWDGLHVQIKSFRACHGDVQCATTRAASGGNYF